MHPKEVGAHGAHPPKWVVQPDHKMLSTADSSSGISAEIFRDDFPVPLMPGAPRLFSMGDREVSRTSSSRESPTSKAVKKQFQKLCKNMAYHAKAGG